MQVPAVRAVTAFWRYKTVVRSTDGAVHREADFRLRSSAFKDANRFSSPFYDVEVYRRRSGSLRLVGGHRHADPEAFAAWLREERP
jgi:hypothetical protein